MSSSRRIGSGRRHLAMLACSGGLGSALRPCRRRQAGFTFARGSFLDSRRPRAYLRAIG